MARDIDILLLNLPFAVSRPYISIPTIISYLRSQGISAEACDMNCEFYYRFFTRDNIRNAINHITERFMELNGKGSLPFRDMLEYVVCYDALKEVEENAAKLAACLFPFSDFTLLKDLNIASLLYSLTTIPYFPEMLIAKPKFLYAGAFYEFCVADILKGARSESFYSGILREILEEQLELYRPRVIGISIVHPDQVIQSFFVARLIKEIDRSIHVTVGGPFVSIFLREISDQAIFGLIDSLIYDEGEIPLLQLVHELSRREPDLEKVNSMAYLKDGIVTRTPPAIPHNLEESPPPLYSCLPLEKYLNPPDGNEVLLRFSRGCSWKKCTFCRIELPLVRDYQQLTFEKAYGDLLTVLKDTGGRLVHFTDDNTDPLLLEHISKNLLKDGIDIRWECQTRISPRLTRKRAQLYKQAGCISLKIGVESLGDRILSLMNKGITVRLIDKVLRNIGGILPLTLFMIAGFPGETEDEAVEGHKRLMAYVDEGLVNDYIYSPFQLMHGSDIRSQPEKYGITGIKMYERCDLPSNTFTFTGGGFSREKLFLLLKEFSAWRWKRLPEFNNSMRRYENEISSIEIRGEVVKLRFDIKEGLSKIENTWELNHLPRGEWVRMGGGLISPLMPGNNVPGNIDPLIAKR